MFFQIKYILVSLIIFLFSGKVFSQQFVDPREAKDFFKNRNYAAAIPIYEKLLKQEQGEPEYFHNLGICYLRTNIDNSKAISSLEKAIKFAKVDPEAFFDLGLAYQLNYKFEDAIKMYKKYKSMGNMERAAKADRAIETCATAKELMKFPVNVIFENLGPTINSEFPDYYPFVAKDESFIVFTSRRKGNIGGEIEFDGFYSSDIYISEKTAGVFGKAKNAGSAVNTSYDEQSVGLSDDAKTMFVYIDHIDKFGDIYTSERKLKTFLRIIKMGTNVNSSSLEASASISADGNTLFFSSAMPDGQGGLDLYMCRKLPTGEWALPQNIGPQLNTKYNEDFPTLSSDGQTLYFCSEGHSSMGGYDIFISKWDEENNLWSPPQNIGYPMNTPDDERVISFTEEGRTAYVSAFRTGGLGDLDIYKVTFDDVDPLLIIYQLKVLDNAKAQVSDVQVSVTDKSNVLVGNYLPNNSGVFTIVLKPGIYNLNVDAMDFKPYIEKVIVTEDECKKGMVKKNVVVSQ